MPAPDELNERPGTLGEGARRLLRFSIVQSDRRPPPRLAMIDDDPASLLAVTELGRAFGNAVELVWHAKCSAFGMERSIADPTALAFPGARASRRGEELQSVPIGPAVWAHRLRLAGVFAAG